MSKDTSESGLVDNLMAEFRESLSRDGLHHSTVRLYAQGGRHFVVWLENDGALLADADDGLLQRFARHSCDCAGMADRKWPARTPQLSASGAVRFVRFLEARDLVRHPGELAEGFRLAEAFAQSVCAQGFQPSTADTYRHTFTHFVLWLHQCRIPLDRVDAGVAARFAAHDCLCLGPPWRPPVKRFRGRRAAARVARFTDFLAGRDARAGGPLHQPPPPDARLEPFRQWLLRNRGIAECSVGVYLRTLRSLLRDIGYDVARYDAALLRDAVLRQFERMSSVQARLLTTAFRAYLRYLASTGQCDAGLLGAVPTARTWRLAAIPRYLPQEDIERAITSCDPTTAVGVRDRAILLLLARLGLRAADVSGLRLDDIDWTRARLIVSGKSRVSSGLPLPQDVGDALLEYVERVRPRVDEEKVFLRIPGPPRPFKRGRAITSVAQRALRRAGVGGPGPRGAHVFRHSVATGLLRSGATLDVVGALLRHRMPATTAIYAKVDVAMLQTVAEPWMGDLR